MIVHNVLLPSCSNFMHISAKANYPDLVDHVILLENLKFILKNQSTWKTDERKA